MAIRRKKTDVVLVGLGAAGGVAALPLTRAGMKVVALEAGGRYTPRDFVPDEIRNDTFNWLGRVKVNGEVPTARRSPSEKAAPHPAPIRMMNGVGGTSIHYTGQSWRFSPYTFNERSETIRRYGRGAIPDGVALADWPLDYADLEPFYDRVEYTVGISGRAGNIQGKKDPRGNVFEGRRRRPYPIPPLRRAGFNDLMTRGARDAGFDPFPGPAAILSEDYRGRQACDYHGYCTNNGCHVAAKSSTSVTTIPLAQQTRNLDVVTRARVTKIVTDKDGEASGVLYVRGGKEYYQPASMVVLATYVYENVRLMMLSRSKAHRKGVGNDRGQLGLYYMAHAYPGVNALFAGRQINRFSGSGAQFVALDNWDADNFDHRGLGFIGGATLSAGMEAKPLGMARTVPPGVPQWGSAWKDWVKRNANSVGSAFVQLPSMPYEDNKLDLDPTAKDPYGNPVIRITYHMGDNEERMLAFLIPKMAAWLEAAGAQETWAGTLFELPINSHAFGGTRMGNDPDESVVNKWGLVHDTPGLAVLGASTFPSTGSKNPTETVQALAWRTATHLVRNWKRLTT